MPTLRDYDYIRASSTTEALDALSQYGPDAMFLAGGTDLLVQVRHDAISPSCLIDLESISSLGGIAEENGFLSIGAMVTLRQVEKSTAVCSGFPALAQSASDVGAVQLRNRATIGGNLCQSPKCPYYNQSHINPFMRESIKPCIRSGGKTCHTTRWGREISHALITGKSRCQASFGSNVATALAALGGFAMLVSKSGSREVNIEKLYDEDGHPTFASDEILSLIKIPLGTPSTNVFIQYKPNPASYTLLNIGVLLDLKDDGKTCKNARVWLGGVAPRPYEAKAVEEFLRGKKLNSEVIENASRLLFERVDVSEATVAFKVAKARAMCREALIKASETG